MKTKDKVLEILTNMRGEYISGQEIAEKVFMTRAAVWKAIKNLQLDGYEIDAVTNKGYRLINSFDIIDSAKIKELFKPNNRNINVEYFEEVTSTNDVAMELIKKNNVDYLVIAGKQTKGRGRRGRNFYSPKNTGLYMSYAFRTSKSIEELSKITAITASATALSIDEAAFDGEDITKIKWVNDIFINGLKVAGILTEASCSLEEKDVNYIVIGIGINIYNPRESFPKEIKNIAGTVFNKDIKNKNDIRNSIAAGIVNKINQYLNEDAGCLECYRNKSFLIGNYIKINSFDGDNNYAYVTGITDDYHLLVKYDDGSTGELTTGEVSVYKY